MNEAATSRAATFAALKVTGLQAALLLTWTQYALFLPGMAESAGIDRRWVGWILLADQLIFVVADWLAGVQADRLVLAMQKLGHWIAAASGATALGLAVMPYLARPETAGWWLACLAAWALCSSFLRAPAFSLLGRAGGVSRKSGLVSWSLVGVSLAGALGPVLTGAVMKLDPALPMLAAAAVLLVAAGVVSRLEAPGSAAAAVPGSVGAQALALAGVVLLCSLGVQIHTNLVPAGLTPGLRDRADAWPIVFWVGFALGLPLGAWIASRTRERVIAGAIGLLAGGLMFAAARVEAELPWMLAQAGCGAAWAIVFVVCLGHALRGGRRAGVGSAVGLLFSAMAAAAVTRLSLSLTGSVAGGGWLSVGIGAWLLGSVALLAAARWLAPLKETP